MTEFDALEIIYNWRLKPELTAVPEILELTHRERFLNHKVTAIGWSGVIVALCERHPEKVKQWEERYGRVIAQACRVANHPSSHCERQWADHLAFRWLILGTDQAAWTLLLLAHHSTKALRDGAQRAIEGICTGIELNDRNGRPVLNSQGTVIGTVRFEDMRQQIMILAREFSIMTWPQRRLPFSLLPFSKAYRLQHSELQHSPLLEIPDATGLIQ